MYYPVKLWAYGLMGLWAYGLMGLWIYGVFLDPPVKPGDDVVPGDDI